MVVYKTIEMVTANHSNNFEKESYHTYSYGTYTTKELAETVLTDKAKYYLNSNDYSEDHLTTERFKWLDGSRYLVYHFMRNVVCNSGTLVKEATFLIQELTILDSYHPE